MSMELQYPYIALSILLVVSLFVTKRYLFQRFSTRRAAILFVAVFFGAIPLTWVISPDWNNPSVAPIANWVGSPIILLTVPAVSFLIDIASASSHHSMLRNVFELGVGVPLWGVSWILFEFTVLGWGWI